MNPDPYPSLLERADEYDTAAQRALDQGDYVFSKYCTNEANTLRAHALAVEARRKAGG